MTKRFQVTDNRDNPFLCDWNVTDYADGGIVHHPMTSENMANVMCDLLNELHEENEKLHDEIFRLRTELAYDRTVNDGKDWFKAEDEHLKWKSGEDD